MEKRQLTEAEQKAFEARMKAAGITVVTDAPSTVTLLKKVETKAMAGRARGGRNV